MEQQKKCRSVLRAMFTKQANSLDVVLKAERSTETLQELEASWRMLEEKYQSLKEIDKQIFHLILEQKGSEEDLTAELTSCDDYNVRYMKISVICQQFLQPREEVGTAGTATTIRNRSVDCQGGLRKFKLPTIEFKKFGGDVREWLPFWSQFRKIHEDDDIDLEDKFQYLLQAMLPGSRARELIASFPPTKANYSKAIESLKSRFGRDDVLIEVYVRELLKLVLNNVSSNNTKLTLSTLYDRIETQLRALESLGVTTDKCAAMLYPLVESSLSEDLIRVWQRSTDFSTKATLKDRLDALITFLKNEVESEERISLAVEGFGLQAGENKFKKSKLKPVDLNSTSIPTAAGLLSCEVSKCTFCDGSHNSTDCFKARKLSLQQKREILIKKRACFRCLKTGHQIRKCRDRITCVACNGQHAVLLCPDIPVNKSKYNNTNQDEPKLIKGENSLGNYTNTRVFLQTIRVIMRNELKTREVRAIVDTGSQRSYILRSTAESLQYVEKRREKIVHALFGGTNTAEQEHHCFDVHLLSKDRKYSCTFEVLDQPLICTGVSSIFEGSWTKELQSMQISLTDTQNADPIEMLIGADVAGKLLTGRRRVLKCGLCVVQTHLGWTLMGKIPTESSEKSTSMTVMCLLMKEMSVDQLWQLDVLGITDPVEKRMKHELELAAKELFNKTIVIDEEGRYEVVIPWLECHPPLPTNYLLAKKRLDNVVKKLKAGGHKEAYNKIFEEWKDLGIIEEVPESEKMSQNVHYLPHHPVFKESSATTKIRPVFDASAKEKNKPSLNQCLEKGANLIELIPTILWRFRMLQFGVVSDIAKAFLQVSLNSTDRDVLRFIWKNDNNQEIIYRHRRVVFGLSCSPFLLGATIEYHLNKLEKSNSPYSNETISRLQKSFYVDNCVTSLPTEEELNRFILESSQLMAEGKFDLRGWEFTNNSLTNNVITPVLGLTWNRKEDVLTINSECCKNILIDVISKRVVLSTVQRVFDPIGFSCPVTLLPKLLLQRTWKTKLSWDTEIEEGEKSTFKKWIEELPILAEIKIPRWFGVNFIENQVKSLHIFCDASQDAYAAGTGLALRIT